MDAHFDLATDLDARRRLFGMRNVFSDRHAGRIREGGWNCLTSSLFITSNYVPEVALRKALDQIAALHAEIEEQPGFLALCRSMEEADAANAAGKTAVFLSLEGLEPLGSDLELLRIFYKLGVRAVGIAWSRRNYAADGCALSSAVEGRRGGLTAFGIEVVRAAERLGMLLDISHLNDEGVEDLARFTTKPFIASHSNCRALVPVMRNLTDEQIKLVASRGGVVGMNGCSVIVAPERADMRALAEHVDHVVRLVGIDHVGLGLDCCDRLQSFFHEPPAPAFYDVVGDHGKLPEFVAVLIAKGYGDDDIAKIVGGNFRRVYEAVL